MQLKVLQKYQDKSDDEFQVLELGIQKGFVVLVVVLVATIVVEGETALPGESVVQLFLGSKKFSSSLWKQ